MTYSTRLTELATHLMHYDVQHFGAKEFGKIGTASGKYTGPRLALPEDVSVMLPVILLAEALRDAWGDRLVVISSYRPPEYNAALGGSPNSRHMRGKALDLRADGDYFFHWIVEQWEQGAFRAWAEEIEEGLDKPGRLWVGFGVYTEPHNRFIHIDCGYSHEPGGRPRDVRFK